jgi:hypothetical protein
MRFWRSHIDLLSLICYALCCGLHICLDNCFCQGVGNHLSEQPSLGAMIPNTTQKRESQQQ